MKIVEAKVGVIGGKLRRSVGNAHQRWTERKSVLIVLRDEEGRIGLGEAAPLPGYSPDTLEECRSWLSNFVTNVTIGGPFEALVQTAKQGAAAAFAAETALFDLNAQERGAFIPLEGGRTANQLTRQQAGPLKRCGLIDGDPSTWRDSWAELRARSVSTVKIKVGRPGRAEEELRALQNLRAQPGDWKLRLDANGAWSEEEAAERLNEFAELRIEFVEQPVLPGLLYRLGLQQTPWAADESLRDPEDAGRLLASACRVFVLKLAVLGGALGRGADPFVDVVPLQKSTIFSHIFDGPVAMAASCEWALTFQHTELAAGLDTHDALSAWPEMPIPQLQTPGLITPASEPGLGFTREQREEIASWIS